MRPTNPLDILHVLGGDYSSPEPTVAPLRLTNVGVGSAQIYFSPLSGFNADIRYRKNGQGEYVHFPTSSGDQLVLWSGDYVEVIGSNLEYTGSSLGVFTIPSPYQIEASGSIMSLLYGEELDEENNLIMPANGRILRYLFTNCAGLITPPELPATSLVGSCYAYLFDGCSNLQYAPELPAETLAYGCYESMFRGCVSLTGKPVIAATTYAAKCCSTMFLGCSSLTQAPDILAELLPSESLQYMFSSCTSLQEIRVNFTTWSYATYAWLGGVAANGVFKCPAALDTSTRDSSHIPAGWTIETF